MVKPAKIEQVQSLKDKFSSAKICVLTEYRGMTVGEMQALRRQLREKNVEFRVVKNLLARRALAELGQDTLDDWLRGQIAIAFGYSDPIDSVKTLVSFQKGQEKLKVKGAILQGKRLDLPKIEELARMPTMTELYGNLVGSLKAPVTRLIWVLKGTTVKLIQVLSAISKERS